MERTSSIARWAVPLALACALAATGPASARARNTPAAEAARAMRDFARCAARLHTGDALALLATPRGSKAEHTASKHLAAISEGCLSGRTAAIRFDLMLLRGGVAEALYLERFGKSGAPATLAEPRLDPAMFEDKAYAVLADFANCAAAAQPASVHAFLLSEPGTPDEKGAVAALAPTLSPCLPAGLDADFSPSQLRAYLAEALHGLSKAGPARN